MRDLVRGRVVPVHNELIELGVLDYHRKMTDMGQTRLFPAAVRNDRGQMCADFSRFFLVTLINWGSRTVAALVYTRSDMVQWTHFVEQDTWTTSSSF